MSAVKLRDSALPGRRVKLLVGILNKQDELLYTEACNECCVAVHFSGIGSGTARSGIRSFFGIDEIEKRVVLSLIPNTSERQVLANINSKLNLYLPGKGVAFTVPISGISDIVSNAVLSTPDKSDKNSDHGKRRKKRMRELIIAVVHQKYTDAAIDAANRAGAAGCTLMHTRSIANTVSETRIGTSFNQETDTLTFLTTSDFKKNIMEAIGDVAGLKTEGSGVIFSLPVDEIIGIGRYGEEETEES